MSIQILTDSASDLTQSLSEKLTVLPLTVTFGETQFQDGVTLTHDAFYTLLEAEDSLPITSQITPAQFDEAFRRLTAKGDTVIAITLASKLSGTCQSARIAAEAFPEQVFVIDSESAAVGEAILVQEALRLADAGLSANEIVTRLEECKTHIRLVAFVDTLTYLHRGGRLSASVTMLGSLLSIKPILSLKHGEIGMLGKARGVKNGITLFAGEIEKVGGIDPEHPLALGYTGKSDALLQEFLTESPVLSAQAERAMFLSAGATIGTHVGPGAVLCAFFQKDTAADA